MSLVETNTEQEADDERSRLAHTPLTGWVTRLIAIGGIGLVAQAVLAGQHLQALADTAMVVVATSLSVSDQWGAVPPWGAD